LLEQGGLTSTKHGARVSFEDGKPTVTDGPFAETKELIAGYALLNVKDLDDAIAEALKLPMKRQLELRPVGGSCEVVSPVNGKPQWMLQLQTAGEPVQPTAEAQTAMFAKMEKYNDELRAAGVLVAGVGLQSSAQGARVNLATRDIVHGPFTNNFLLCGWWTIQVATKQEAIDWAKRVPIENGTIEVRQLFNPHMRQEGCDKPQEARV
jgi:hypothetical protein